MSWKMELDHLESMGQWDAAVRFLEQSIERYPDDPQFHIRSIYLLLNLLLEEDYSAFKLEHDDLEALLKQYFEDSREKFKDNAEYLFFVGYLISVAEWYFGQDDVQLSHQMLKQAVALEPDNRLYQWADQFARGAENAKDLCKQVRSDPALMSSLKSKGPPGHYLVEMIEGSCEA